MRAALFAAIGLMAGIISGMGIGGGVLLIPALTLFMGVGQRQAQSMNLLYFLPTASVALIQHFKAGNVEKRIMWKLVVSGVIGAAGGALLAVYSEPGILRKLFGGFLVIMGAIEFMKKK